MVASFFIFNSSQCVRYTRHWGRRLGWFDVEWFRNISPTRALIVAILASAGSGAFVVESYGATRDTAQLQLTGNIPSICAFTTLPSVTTLGDMTAGGVKSLGSFGFTCNLATSGAVQLTVQSANGALKRDGGTDAVAYQVNWSIQGNPVASGSPAVWTSPFAFALLSGVNGAEQIGTYSVTISGPTSGLVAGDYKDTLTYTISP
ncbi:MAG: hypothetical protein ABL973_08985 [Micropepsaceae bacterium]